MTPRYLADNSALARMMDLRVDAVLSPLISAGRIATCGIVDLEVLFSARGPRDFARTRRRLALSFARVLMIQRDFDRAIDVMEALAARGVHRSAKIPDLLIAAVAERAGLTVLHYDEDFDRIAAVTGQPVEWVVSRGSL